MLGGEEQASWRGRRHSTSAPAADCVRSGQRRKPVHAGSGNLRCRVCRWLRRMTGLQEENGGGHRRGEFGKDRKQEAWPVNEKNSLKLKSYTGMSSVRWVYSEGMLNWGGLVAVPPGPLAIAIAAVAVAVAVAVATAASQLRGRGGRATLSPRGPPSRQLRAGPQVAPPPWRRPGLRKP